MVNFYDLNAQLFGPKAKPVRRRSHDVMNSLLSTKAQMEVKRSKTAKPILGRIMCGGGTEPPEDVDCDVESEIDWSADGKGKAEAEEMGNDNGNELRKDE
ncbi:hypothetical protein AZE42_05777 [Rhizopogon vesiculosus]|uniref:Uncharacterized protein n=1 Tax=Rhizopogon vesiculosus TaxID=180088 RepID=A0A1J8PTW5_9AGAM|nr:hypothetical protein AZE42_05777 [Rhizopogon vesiculosus]